MSFESMIVMAGAWGVAGGLASNLFRSWWQGASYGRRVRAAIAERRQALPEEPTSPAEAVPGEMIALRGTLGVDAGCEPFLPMAKLEALSLPDPGSFVASAREIGGEQELRLGSHPRLITEGLEVALPAGDELEGQTRLVLGTHQMLGHEDRGGWSRQAVYLSLRAGDEVWVVGRLQREVDDTAGQESYRQEPKMRYALAEPVSFYATGDVEVRFRRLSASAIDLVFGVAATIIAGVWLSIL